ncbi:N-acetyl-beta-D-galactosaminidase [Fragilaria crotonensis]|nr:N-acetyl-beta-D-galactosaminidase [Fragilaria crotonensis]
MTSIVASLARIAILIALLLFPPADALVPHPKVWNQTASSAYLRTIQTGDFELVTDSPYILQGAAKRISDWFRLPDVFMNYPVNPSGKELISLCQLYVLVESNCTDLIHGVDESYVLTIPTNSSVTLQSKTVFGALRGLETFAQLIQYGWIEVNTGQVIFTLSTPQYIEDAPSYPYRGLLIDTARHYLPMELLLTNLDAMAINKLNVLHWHMTDSQSWPYQSQQYPELSDKGAFRSDLVYSKENIERLVREAYYRGIRVIPEFDLPGHSAALAKSHPEWMSHCTHDDNNSEPPILPILDPTNRDVHHFIKDLYAEIFTLFTTADMIHLGGDEVPLECWKNDPAIQHWMRIHNVTDEIMLFGLFEEALLAIVETRQPIVWQEVFDLGVHISPNTIVDVWKQDQDADTMHRAIAAGHRVVLSSCWYLDHLDNDWYQYYQCDPRDKLNATGGTTDAQYERVLGGHASMWGERVDSSNFMSRVWPRASSMAERLWSGSTASDETTIRERMTAFRCHMVRRGINAGPIGPGVCDKEPRFNKNAASFDKEDVGPVLTYDNQ